MKGQFDYADFYKCNYASAVCYACTFVGNEDDARDMVGEAFLQLLELSGRLDTEKNVRSLLLSIVHNKCMDYLRRLQCYCGVELRVRQTADRFSDDEFAALCQKELFRIVGQTLSDMPEVEREVFTGVRLDGKSYKEVALQTNMDRRHVEYRLRRATEKVRRSVLQMYG